MRWSAIRTGHMVPDAGFHARHGFPRDGRARRRMHPKVVAAAYAVFREQIEKLLKKAKRGLVTFPENSLVL
jgi:hypothetical protein